MSFTRRQLQWIEPYVLYSQAKALLLIELQVKSEDEPRFLVIGLIANKLWLVERLEEKAANRVARGF